MSKIAVTRSTLEDFIFEVADDQFDRDYFEMLVNAAQLTRLYEMQGYINETITEVEKVNNITIEERETFCTDCLYHGEGCRCVK